MLAVLASDAAVAAATAAFAVSAFAAAFAVAYPPFPSQTTAHTEVQDIMLKASPSPRLAPTYSCNLTLVLG